LEEQLQQKYFADPLLGFECMVHVFGLHDYLWSLAWDFLRLAVVSTLPFHFLDGHGVIGFVLS